MKTAVAKPTLILLLFTLFISSHQVSAQFPTDSAEMYLLTLSPGTETYEAFGHSAIRVYDRKQGINFVYNWGTFDFSTSNFYPKFLFGRLLYYLSIDDYRDFFMAYKMYGRAMWEQKLNLSKKEKWQLFNNLQLNYQIENRFYRYAFFRDNCSSRIRDIIEKSVDGHVIYDSSLIKRPESFRQLFSACLDFREPWPLFGMDVLMGKRTDNEATLKDHMFLPDYLMNLLAAAKVSTNGSSKILTQKPVEVFPATLTFPKPNPWTSPTTVFWALFCLTLVFTYVGFKKKRYFKWFDVILFLISGLLGLLLLVLMSYSLHDELWSNYNIVWANPLNLIFMVGVFKKTKPKLLLYLMRAYGVLLVIFIPASFLLTQVIPGAAYPLMGMLLLRIAKAQMIQHN